MISLAHKDIISSRDPRSRNHPGNKRFRELILANAIPYFIKNKREKMMLTKFFVKTIKENNGRFVEMLDGEWYEMSDLKARAKVSHALLNTAKKMIPKPEPTGAEAQTIDLEEASLAMALF